VRRHIAEAVNASKERFCPWDNHSLPALELVDQA
jgi:hypothetical protein